MAIQLLHLLGYINLFSLLIPIGIGLLRWRELSVSLRFAWAGLTAYFLLFLASFGLSIWPIGMGNLFLDYWIAGLFGIAFVFCYCLAVPAGWQRQLIWLLGAIGVIGLITEAILLARSSEISQWAIPLQTVINTIVPLIYLNYLTRSTAISVRFVPLFWISIGRLISSTLSTLYDALHAPMAESSRDLLIQWLCFQISITIACNFLYGYGFWKAR
jgi:hypothetical protein